MPTRSCRADWLCRQLGYAHQGWDVVLGTVRVTDWNEHPPHVPVAFEARYDFGAGRHPHVHGANLGLRASAYLAVGGFRSLPTAEDHALVAAVTKAGYAVLQPATSRWRPRPAAAPGPRGASATCSARWP